MARILYKNIGLLLAAMGVLWSMPMMAQTLTDVAPAAGVDDPSVSRAGSWGDFDNDGDPDIYVTNNTTNRLYQNNGNGTFTDIANSAGVDLNGNQRAAVWGDFDNDGDLDIYVANSATVANNPLYRNNGDNTFTDIGAVAGVDDTGLGLGVAWGDYDNDGYLDIYLTNGNSGVNKLYQNNGNSTFLDVSVTAGVNDASKGQSVAWGDYDSDGDLDIFRPNNASADQLYRNNGDGTFTDVASSANVNDAGQNSGVSWADYDNDGDLDLYVTRVNVASFLYRNNGNNTFTNVASSAGVTSGGDSRGIAWGDYDNDGDLDLYVNNDNGGNHLYQNDGSSVFVDVISSVGGQDSGNSFGASWADYDQDGDLDLYVTNGVTGANRLFQNSGNSNRWLQVTLQGVLSSRDGIGAKVTVVMGANRQRQNVDGNAGYHSQGTLPIEFGFGATTNIDSLIVQWPSGIVWDTTNVATNQALTLYEPASLDVSIPQVAASLGDTLSIPVQVSDLMAFDVLSGEINIAFDTTVVKSLGTSLTGSLAASGWFNVDNVVSGIGGIDTLKIVMFTGVDTLSSSGDLIYLNFVATGPDTFTTLEMTHFLLNSTIVPSSIQNGSVHIQGTSSGLGLTVSIPDTTAKYSTTVDIPIHITDTSGLGIVASEVSVTYRNDIVLSAVTNLTTTAGTVTTNSMVYQGWSVEENVFAGSSVDTLTIAMSTALDTLSGAGDLIYLTLQVADVRSPDTTPLELVKVLLNDGTPSATSIDGSLKITGTDATISTSPDSIRPGETVSITLNDVDLDLDVGVAEQVSVTAYSVTYGDSQSVNLTETGVNTGEFTGTVSTEFSAVAGTPQDGVIGTIAGDSIGVVAIDVLTSAGNTSPLYALPVPVYGGADGVVSVSYVVQALDGRNGVRDTVRVQIADADLDLDVGLAEQVSTTITNAISGESEGVILTETDVNTGVFQARVPTIAGASGTHNDGVLSLASWDTLSVSYTDSLSSQGGLSTVNDITRVVNLFGDVQSNDQIQAFDAARLLAISVGLVSSNTQTTLVGDVDGGGAIQAFDASLVLQYVVRLIDRFPVQTDFTADPKNHPFEKPVLNNVIALGDLEAQGDGTYLVPVQLSEREGVLSGTLTFGADAGVEIMDVMLANDYGSFMVAHNTTAEGVKVAFAGSQSELSGSGDVLLLRVRGVEGMPIRLSLDQVVLNGQSLTPSVNIEALETVESAVSEFVTELHQNLPNPFNPETTIRYGLSESGQVTIVIYSVTGQRVRTLVSAFQGAGAYQVTWDGLDALGHQVSSGVYLMRMTTDGFVQTRKMLMMK